MEVGPFHFSTITDALFYCIYGRFYMWNYNTWTRIFWACGGHAGASDTVLAFWFAVTAYNAVNCNSVFLLYFLGYLSILLLTASLAFSFHACAIICTLICVNYSEDQLIGQRIATAHVHRSYKKRISSRSLHMLIGKSG